MGKRIKWAFDRYSGSVCLLDKWQEKNLIGVPGDGMYLVPREVACLMQRIEQECEVPVEVKAETYMRQIMVKELVHGRIAILTFEHIEDGGVASTLDWVCALFTPNTEVMFATESVETATDEMGITLDKVRRRIVVRRKGEGYEQTNE